VSAQRNDRIAASRDASLESGGIAAWVRSASEEIQVAVA
jgi:hypothetical protein